MNVVSFYFPLWLTVEKGVPEIVYSFVYGGAILFASLISPILGLLSDLKQSRYFPLIVGTLVSVFFTSLMGGVVSAKMALLFFFFAHAGYIVSLVFYNAMLPEVSEGSTPGKICGLGVGLGYVGTIFGLWMAGYFEAAGRQAVFLPTALMFLVFSLPLFLMAPRFRKKEPLKSQQKEKKTFKALAQIWNIRQHPKKIQWFFLANFMCGDAVHTVILYMAVYAHKVFGMEDAQIRLFFIISTAVAILASFVWGEQVSRKGALKAMKQVLIIWLFTFILASLANQEWLYWVIGGLVGVGLSGTWVAARVLVVELVPKERIGEYYGFYNLTGKSAAILGPIWWGGLLLIFSSLGILKYRLTLLSLSLFILISLWALKKINHGTTKLLH